MIWHIVRILEVVYLFLQKPFWFFWGIFFNFRLDTIKKQGIINLNSYRGKIYASVFLTDSKVTFLKEGKDAAFCSFLYCVLLKFIVAWLKKYVIKFPCFSTSRNISLRPAAFLLLIFSEWCQILPS